MQGRGALRWSDNSKYVSHFVQCYDRGFMSSIFLGRFWENVSTILYVSMSMFLRSYNNKSALKRSSPIVVHLRSLINRTEELDLSTDAAEMELNDNR